MLFEPVPIKVLRPGQKGYDWRNFPDNIDLLAIDRITHCFAQVCLKFKNLPNTEIGLMPVRIEDGFLSLSQITVRSSFNQRRQESYDVELGESFEQAVIDLISMVYTFVNRFPRMYAPEVVKLQNLTNVGLRTKLTELLCNSSAVVEEQAPKHDPRLTETMIALLRHTKDQNVKEFSFEGLREVLGPIYHKDMRQRDIITVLTNAYMDMVSISEFQMPYRGQPGEFIKKLLMAPVDSFEHFLQGGLREESTMTVTEFYTHIVKHMLNDIMLTNVGWCRHTVFPERVESA